MSRLRAARRSGRVIVCGALCLFICGCVMIESYYKPLPRQGKILGSTVTWNCADDLQVNVSPHGAWTIYQRFEGWHNLLSVQLWLSLDPDKKMELKSDEVTLVAGMQQHTYKLTETRIKGYPNLRRESRFQVDLGKDPVPEFTLVLPDVAVDNQTIVTNPLQFRKKKGLVFYRSLQ